MSAPIRRLGPWSCWPRWRSPHSRRRRRRPHPRAAAPTAATFALSAAGKSGALRLRSAPGRTVRGAVLVRNLSRRPIVRAPAARRHRNATNGGADFITARRSAAGRWVRLAATTVRLAPRASRKVGFSVHIPAGTRGASHYAGIVAFDAADVTAAARDRKRKSKGTSFKISRITRQALPITLRLPGPHTRKLTLRSVSIKVEPAGAGLVLGLRPGGTILTAVRAGQAARLARQAHHPAPQLDARPALPERQLRLPHPLGRSPHRGRLPRPRRHPPEGLRAGLHQPVDQLHPRQGQGAQA